MINFIKKNYILLLIFAFVFVIFLPSLFVFYTNDDFFLLKISNINSFTQFFNFFSLAKGPDGLGMYRPLTSQVFYFLSWKLFNLNPLGLHIISFLVFFGVIYLVYRLSIEIVKDQRVAYITAFLYAVSATHFGHLYYLATFQELGMTAFVLLSCLSFIKNKRFLSFLFFILALMSKETAVITPFLIGLIYWFERIHQRSAMSVKKFLMFLLPFIICLFAYLLIRFASYGFATGDTYIWDFSVRKMINTVVWYLLWGLNLPETLLDFIGPGLKVNPNLFTYWSKQIIPILILFLVQGTGLLVILFRSLFEKSKKLITEGKQISLFCIAWFLISLLPVIFLPEHKFTFYLTLPLAGLVLRIAYLLIKSKLNVIFVGTFLLVWTTLSILTVKHTVNISWISQSENAAKRVYDFMNEDRKLTNGKEIVFVDTSDDLTLPWSPTSVVKVVLSGNNFFDVFFPSISGKVHFGYPDKIPKEKLYIITSRTFLGY